MTFGSTPPVTPVKQPRRRDPKQTTFEFRPTGRGGARPGAGRPRKYRSRMPHRTRERIPGYCPVLITLRVRDDDHVHLIVEAAGKVRLANGMKAVDNALGFDFDCHVDSVRMSYSAWRGCPRFVHGDGPQVTKERWAKGGQPPTRRPIGEGTPRRPSQ